MTDTLLSIAIALGVLGLEYLIFRKKLRAAWGSPRRSVLKHIANPGVAFTVELSNLGGVWNPAHQRVNRYDPPVIYGRGLGTYWRDELDHVHLLFQPETGSPRHLAAVAPADVPSPYNWAVRGVLATLAAALVGGFIIGYTASSGSAGDRATFGLFGAIAGYVALSLLALIFRVGRAMRMMSRGNAEPPSVDAPPVDLIVPVEPGPVPGWVLAVLDDRRTKRARTLRRVPRPGPLALFGVGILSSSLVLEPLSNSEHVSARIGDLLFYASDALGFGGLLLLVLALICFIARR